MPDPLISPANPTVRDRNAKGQFCFDASFRGIDTTLHFQDHRNTMHIRLATTLDQPGIIDLISSVYQEYGEQICLENADQDLLKIEAYYFDRGGAFWVLERNGKIVGSHAAHASFHNPQVCTFRRLYLSPELRGTHWGTELMQVTIDWARAQKFPRIEFWSDTRFERAHRFFEKFGFRKSGEIREMHDGFEPYSEWFFFLDL